MVTFWTRSYFLIHIKLNIPQYAPICNFQYLKFALIHKRTQRWYDILVSVARAKKKWENPNIEIFYSKKIFCAICRQMGINDKNNWEMADFFRFSRMATLISFTIAYWTYWQNFMSIGALKLDLYVLLYCYTKIAVYSQKIIIFCSICPIV